MRRRTAVALVALLPLALSACSGSKPAASNPADALAKAKTAFDTAAGVSIELSTDTPIPKGVPGVSAAKGAGTINETTPKFKGHVTAMMSGVSAQVELISIGDKSWMSLFGTGFNSIDLAKFNAPNPSYFFKPQTGVSSILSKATDVKAGKEERRGKEVLQTYTGTVPGAVVKDLLRLGDGTATFAGVFAIEPTSGQLREAKLTGPFYPGTSSTYTVALTDYGKTVDIQEP